MPKKSKNAAKKEIGLPNVLGPYLPKRKKVTVHTFTDEDIAEIRKHLDHLSDTGRIFAHPDGAHWVLKPVQAIRKILQTKDFAELILTPSGPRR